MKEYLTTQLREFAELDVGSKICLLGSWVTVGGAALLIGTSAITVTSWMQGEEPNSHIKKALASGLGIVVGGALFTTGAAIENDRQNELSAENIYKVMAERRAQREASPCPNCKYFSNNCDLYCALNPDIACTPKATNCKDFESKEVN